MQLDSYSFSLCCTGLFRHAIAQSGSFLDPWAYTRKPLRYAVKLANHLGCDDTNSSSAIVDCLKNVPAKTIANSQIVSNLTHKFYLDPIAAFGPTVEVPTGDGSSAFLPANPLTLLTSGNINKVPLLGGVVKEEGIYLWAACMITHKINKELRMTSVIWDFTFFQIYYLVGDLRLQRGKGLLEILLKLLLRHFILMKKRLKTASLKSQTKLRTSTLDLADLTWRVILHFHNFVIFTQTGCLWRLSCGF